MDELFDMINNIGSLLFCKLRVHWDGDDLSGQLLRDRELPLLEPEGPVRWLQMQRDRIMDATLDPLLL